HGRSATTRSTGAGEILPMLYELAGVSSPAPGITGLDEPGYPLVADASNSAVWFYGGEPFAFVAAWGLAAGNPRIRWARSWAQEMDHGDSGSWCNCHGRCHRCRMALVRGGGCCRPARLPPRWL